MELNINDLNPKSVWTHFLELTKRQHNSGNENEVRKYVADVISNNSRLELVYYKQDATEPGERVIVARKVADDGMENQPIVVLQSHMDMVCLPNDQIFPLKLIRYNENGIDWLKAGGRTKEDGTTLGADDGIGVAAALAILEDTNLKTGTIECLFTVQEETDMGGAQYFDPKLLTGRTYINLDEEDLKVIIYGSAGGALSTIRASMSTENLPNGNKAVELEISQLVGGHSGVNINQGRGNAIQLLARTLFELNKRECDYNIASFNGGIKMNAIPNYAKVVLAVSEEAYEQLTSTATAIFTQLKDEYKIVEPDMKCELKGLDMILQEAFDHKSTTKLVNLLLVLPHGVLKMNPERPDIVQTSTNLAIVKTVDNEVTITCSQRSSSESALDWVCDIHLAIANVHGVEIEFTDKYPSWAHDENSKLLKIARNVYKDKYGSEYTSTIVHAGLECGFAVAKYENDSKMDCISIGPTVKDPHTVNERIDIASVADFYDCMTKLLNGIYIENNC